MDNVKVEVPKTRAGNHWVPHDTIHDTLFTIPIISRYGDTAIIDISSIITRNISCFKK